MAYTGVYERTIFYNPVNKYSVISVKTSDRSIPEKARSAYRHRDNMIHFAAVGYELPRTDQVSMILDLSLIHIFVAKKLRYQATLRSTVDNAEDILVRYRAEEMCLLIDEIGKITEFSYPLMLKTLDRVVVNTNGKLSFIFQSGIKITV